MFCNNLRGKRIWKSMFYIHINTHTYTHTHTHTHTHIYGLPQWLSSIESTCMQEIQETWVWSLGQEDPLEKGMVTHSSILAWRIPWTEEPHRLQFMGSQRVGHSGATKTFTNIYIYLNHFAVCLKLTHCKPTRLQQKNSLHKLYNHKYIYIYHTHTYTA